MTNRTFEEVQQDVDKAIDINDAEALLRYATELDSLGTPQAAVTANGARGWAFYLRGDYPAALQNFHSALTHHEELGNRSGVASASGNIANVYQITGNYPAALEHLHRTLMLYQELGDRGGVAVTMGNIGTVLMSTGDLPAALEHFHRELALREELGIFNSGAGTMCNIGMVHSNTGDYPAALEYYHRALALCEESGNRRFAANIIGNIGIVHRSTGNHTEALEHYHRALALHEVLGNRSGVAVTMGNIGNVHRSTGNHLEALEHYRRALALHEELGYRAGVANVTVNIIAAYLSMGSTAEARALLQIADAMQIDEPDTRIERELYRATLQECSDDLDGAAMTLQHALREALEHGLRSSVADVHKALRDLALKQNNLADYVEHNNEYTRITEEINGKDTATKLAMQAKQREIDAVQREHAQHMAVLHSTLPKHIADRVARGETVNDHYDNAAVIFLDIAGFTTISDQLSSADVVHLLDSVFTALDVVCNNHDVVKIKTIGDSYMAVAFPRFARNDTSLASHVSEDSVIPNEVRNPGERAASVALDMLHAISHVVSPIGAPLQARIGLHSGPVTAGVIGTQRMQYDVWGDTVNVASRMESTGDPGRIHVSEAFVDVLRSSTVRAPYTLTPRGMVEVKGKGAMTTYWLE